MQKHRVLSLTYRQRLIMTTALLEHNEQLIKDTAFLDKGRKGRTIDHIHELIRIKERLWD